MGNAARVSPLKFDNDIHHRSILVNYLRQHDGWQTAGQIRDAIGMPPVRVRELCQIYPTMLVSSTDGYKLVANATRYEIVHNVQSLLKRAEKITARASALASQI